MVPKVLVVDDDKAVRNAIRINLQKDNYLVETATNVDDAMRLLSDQPFDLVLTDVRMPGESGLKLLKHIKTRWPDVAIILMTGYGAVEDAVEAIKQGASEYIIKPVSRDALITMIQRALSARKRDQELKVMKEKVSAKFSFGSIIYRDPKMKAIYDLAKQIAETSATVLLQGPTGTGKELLAHAIHFSSHRRDAQFIRVNCAALQETLLESELFGHEKGSFSGAIRQHRGRFELADSGTILLDEIGEISPAVQVKLLRVLEEGEFQRIGGMETLKVDVRIIAATNRILSNEVEAGRFREDLFYRLNVFTIQIPPLRERREDIQLLAEHFVQKYATRNKRKVSRIDPTVMDRLLSYDWPGNVRELEHVMEKAVILGTTPEIRDVDLPIPKTRVDMRLRKSLADALRDCERDVISQAIRDADGVQAKAASRLGISRSNLNYRLNKLHLRVPELMGE